MEVSTRPIASLSHLFAVADGVAVFAVDTKISTSDPAESARRNVAVTLPCHLYIVFSIISVSAGTNGPEACGDTAETPDHVIAGYFSPGNLGKRRCVGQIFYAGMLMAFTCHSVGRVAAPCFIC